jgi:hypothetical protein
MPLRSHNIAPKPQILRRAALNEPKPAHAQHRPLRVCSVASAMAELQAHASSYLAGDGASVDAFLAARRAEAAKQEGTSPDTQDQADATTTEPGRGV